MSVSLDPTQAKADGTGRHRRRLIKLAMMPRLAGLAMILGLAGLAMTPRLVRLAGLVMIPRLAGLAMMPGMPVVIMGNQVRITVHRPQIHILQEAFNPAMVEKTAVEAG